MCCTPNQDAFSLGNGKYLLSRISQSSEVNPQACDHHWFAHPDHCCRFLVSMQIMHNSTNAEVSSEAYVPGLSYNCMVPNSGRTCDSCTTYQGRKIHRSRSLQFWSYCLCRRTKQVSRTSASRRSSESLQVLPVVYRLPFIGEGSTRLSATPRRGSSRFSPLLTTCQTALPTSSRSSCLRSVSPTCRRRFWAL